MSVLLAISLLKVGSCLKKIIKIGKTQQTSKRYESLIYLFAIILVLSEWTVIGAKVSAFDFSISPANGIEPVTVHGTQALEKLSPFHNLYPDAYLDPVSVQVETSLNSRKASLKSI